MNAVPVSAEIDVDTAGRWVQRGQIGADEIPRLSAADVIAQAAFRIKGAISAWGARMLHRGQRRFHGDISAAMLKEGRNLCDRCGIRAAGPIPRA